MRTHYFFLILIGAAVLQERAFAEDQELCSGLLIRENVSLKLSDNEKIFLCGDGSTDEWSRPPIWQRQRYLKAILESKGYFHSQTQVLADRSALAVFPGSPTSIEKIEILGFPEGVERPHFSNFIGKNLTSSLLNEIEELLKTYLAFFGYPCVNLMVKASVAERTIFLSLKEFEGRPSESSTERAVEKPNSRFFTPVKIEEQSKVYPEAVRRFYPFRPGQVFNQQLLDVATRRLRGSGLLNFSRFQTTCEGHSIQIFHDLDMIKPRIFSIGGGFDTERGPLFLTGWKNSRLSKMGSSFEVKLEASFVEQEVSSTYKWYPSRSFPHFFVKNLVSLSHSDEEAFEQNEVEALILPSLKSDFAGYGYSVSAGPQLTYVNVVDDGDASAGVDIDSSEYILLHSEIAFWGHKYEYHQGEPREGVSSFLTLDYSHADWGLGLDVFHLSLASTFLESFGEPIFEDVVFGFRTSLATTIIEDSSKIDLLPNDLKIFMGGSDNFRGFGRKELPFSGVGSLTSAYLGAELRWNQKLPWGLQPFVFTDWVALAEKSLSLANSERFWAPGLGMRWRSPIGAFRMTYARGLGIDEANQDVANNQFFFSYGEEF